MTDDHLPDFRDERRWRKALELVGRGQIQEYLHRYPGNPADLVSDLPVDPPFPTREFCEQWLLADARTVSSYRTLICVLGGTVLIGLSYASCSISNLVAPPSNSGMTSYGTPTQLMGVPSTSVPSPPTAPIPAGPTAPPSPVTQSPANGF